MFVSSGDNSWAEALQNVVDHIRRFLHRDRLPSRALMLQGGIYTCLGFVLDLVLIRLPRAGWDGLD